MKNLYNFLLGMRHRVASHVLVCCCLLLIFTSQKGSAQILEKKITINLDKRPLKEALDQVAATASVAIIFSNEKELFQNIISIHVRDKSLQQVLDLLLKESPFIYRVIDDKIVISTGRTKGKTHPVKQVPVKRAIKGKVTNESGEPLPGATLRIKNGADLGVTDSGGQFDLKNIAEGMVLQISFIGYEPKEVTMDSIAAYFHIVLQPASSNLAEVVVSTGYQTLPAERATGSFVQIDNDLINRSVSPDIISRLQDVTSGLNFDRRAGGQPYLEIRSRGTILANDQPLIVVDNFPYDGDINNINPNDVQSITVLKDAAAASIWGVRAGNGVIVITTKKGQYNQPMKVEFNANLNLGQKPDLSKLDWISSSDYIDLEKNLFSQGYYDANLSNTTNPPAFTPVIELLNAARNGTISEASANDQINALKQYNVLDDMEKYLYRTSADQQYSLNLSGGTEKEKYYFSSGYDNNLDNIVNNGNNRLTLRAANTFRPIKNLELNTDLIYTQTQTKDNGLGYTSISQGTSGSIYPYARLADNNGNPLPIAYNYSNAFIQAAESQGLLNWQYVPLDEIKDANNKTDLTDIRINTSAKYNILKSLSASILYSYERQESTGTNLYSQDTYYTRDLINNFTTVNSDASLTYNIPPGSIYDQSFTTINSNDFRAQLNLDQGWKDNKISAIAGYEVRQMTTTGSGSRVYGYDNDILTYDSQVNYATLYQTYDGNYANIPFTNTTFSGLFSGNVSYYSNAAYTYKDRYTFSGSIRFDQSNLFGVNTNQKGIPLWSLGGSWEIDKENFYKIDWLPYLKIRTTFGYNGNLDQNLSAYTTANYIGQVSSGLNAATIINPPNPDLRWEKSGILNLGIDFATTKRTFSGSLEYYHKKGSDLLGFSPVDATTGVTEFEGNVANNEGNGIDVQLNVRIINGTFKWYTNFLYSYATDKVTKYLGSDQNLNNYVGIPNTAREILPIVGRPVFGIYSYKWAGLDPANGNPRGFLPDGTVSENYTALENVTPQQLDYNGPARPTSFGSWRNTFSYKQFSVSANIAYELGYYFVKPSINYSNLLGFSANGLEGSNDYADRWQKPGDEKITNVPSFIYPFDPARDSFYNGSSALVEKGDNIRLQDLRISYDINKMQWATIPFKVIHLYVYANNLGIIWRANKSGIDPDSPTIPIPRTLAIGFKADF